MIAVASNIVKFQHIYLGKFVHLYGSPARTLAAGSATVIWQVNKGNEDVKEKLESKIVASEKKLESRIMASETNLEMKIDQVHTDVQDCPGMILETAHHTVKAISGEKKPMRQWMERLERCQESGGSDCNPKARGNFI
ncbi:hypothetical protein K440DRAFT_660985 [Wilcoxina mikolae CBS 423.85]|nr:hypothetical protein K440DRAFT_660985 [Wilcoxina mikolae CBS 423.85]